MRGNIQPTIVQALNDIEEMGSTRLILNIEQNQ